jgi:hypothetical protein
MNDGCVFPGEPWALRDLSQFVIGQETDGDRGATDLKRVGPDDGPGNVLLDVRIHALDNRDHGDQEPDGDDDAQEGEEGTKLGAENGLHRQLKGFVEGMLER